MLPEKRHLFTHKKLDNEKNWTFIINSMPFLRYLRTITPEIIQNSKVSKHFGLN